MLKKQLFILKTFRIHNETTEAKRLQKSYNYKKLCLTQDFTNNSKNQC